MSTNEMGPELDLYATEDAEHEFNQDADYIDMYEDPNLKQEADDGMLQSGGNQLNSISGLSTNTGINPRQRTPGLYIGNLTWWTTDQDIMDSLNSIGITDIHEVKFFENRANGQSKGFCVVTFNSDASLPIVMDKLPKIEMHGQNPVVTTCNRQNMNLFESQIRKTIGPQNNNNNNPNNQMQQSGAIMGISSISGTHTGGSIPQTNMGSYHQGGGNPMMGGGGPGGGSMYNRGGYQPHTRPSPRAPLMSRPGMRLNGPMMSGHPRMRAPFNQQQNPQQQWSNVRSGLFNPPPSRLPNNVAPRIPLGMNHQPNMGPGSCQGPAPHVNPAFFPSSHSGQNQNSDMYNRSGTSNSGSLNYNDYRGNTMGDNMLSMNDSEFEEIMNKNRGVSSLAISHAVADAAAGNYQTAMDTLATAVTLIKQSKVSSDERCKILISSLQDTLHGIEAKYYGRGEKTSIRPRSRSRERDYRDSREVARDPREHRDTRDSRDPRETRESRDPRDPRGARESRDSRDSREERRSGRDDREKSSKREKSHRRSRSRDHKERSKERDRYHEDRYREKSDRYKRS